MDGKDLVLDGTLVDRGTGAEQGLGDVIRFQLSSLSAERLEVTASCGYDLAETEFKRLLAWVAQAWPEAEEKLASFCRVQSRWKVYQEFTFNADFQAVQGFLHKCSSRKYWLLWSIVDGHQHTLWPYGFFEPDKTPDFPSETEDTKRRPVFYVLIPSPHDASCLSCMAFRATVLNVPGYAQLETDLALITLNQKKAGECVATLLVEANPIWFHTGKPVEDTIKLDFQSFLAKFWKAMLGKWQDGGKVTIPPKPEPPAKPEKGASLDAWFDYYHAMKNIGYQYTLRDVAKEVGYSYGYIRQQHANYSAEHDDKT